MAERINEGVRAIIGQDQLLDSLRGTKGIRIVDQTRDEAVDHRSGEMRDTTTVTIVPALWRRLLRLNPTRNLINYDNVSEMPREGEKYQEIRAFEPKPEGGHKITNVLLYQKGNIVPRRQ